MIDKGLRKNIKKRWDGEIGRHKLNEIGALNMKQKKWKDRHIVQLFLNMAAH